MNLLDYLPGIPNFPKPGILFRDISPLLGDPKAFQFAIEQLAELAKGWEGPKSLANSAAIFAYPQSHYDVIRPGICLYGVSPIKGKKASDFNFK